MFNFTPIIDLKDVTAIIKTFLRDEYLVQCVSTLRRQYPEIHIIVGDDGRMTDEKRKFLEDNQVEYYEMPWDVGICVGRNFLVDKVKTKYTLVGDDDFYYKPESNIKNLVRLMEIADLAGGAVRQGNAVQHYEGFMKIQGDLMTYFALPLEKWDIYKNVRYKKCDLTFNYFVAKTELLKEVRWDENIHVMYEHSDYFMRLAGKTVVYTPDSIVDHKIYNYPYTEEYARSRFSKGDKPYFFQKWGLKRRIDMHNFVDQIDG